MISSIIGMLGPLILWALNQWIKNTKMEEDQLKNYYIFLRDIDQHTKVDVTNYVLAGNARDETIRRIQQRRKKLGINANGERI